MNKTLYMLVIGLFFGAGIGFLLAASTGAELEGHDHASHGAPHGDVVEAHDHSQMITLPADQPAPTLALELQPEAGSGYNLHIMAENFRFAPENVNGEHVPGEGHAHVYINGVKLARIYGSWFHISSLPDGEVEVKVTLNANSHEALMANGAMLEASLTVPAR